MYAKLQFLVHLLYPEREPCAKRRLCLPDVDLPWGVTEVEGEQAKALDVCLDEIEPCRSFFLGILGECCGCEPSRYGLLSNYATTGCGND